MNKEFKKALPFHYIMTVRKWCNENEIKFTMGISDYARPKYDSVIFYKEKDYLFFLLRWAAELDSDQKIRFLPNVNVPGFNSLWEVRKEE